MKKSKQKGFTLVELVIVIAVIAILSAVLIPTLSNVVEDAHKSAAEQEAVNLRTQILVSTGESFDAYCQQSAAKENYISTIVSSNVLTICEYKIELKTVAEGAQNFSIGKDAHDVWTIAYITDTNYLVTITDSSVSAIKDGSLPSLTTSST